MQPVITKILANKILTEEECLMAALMEDNENEKDYRVFAWAINDKVLQFGYGTSGTHLNYKPTGYADNILKVHFPYTELTEKEAYILCRYEMTKFKKFNYENLSAIGVNNEA